MTIGVERSQRCARISPLLIIFLYIISQPCKAAPADLSPEIRPSASASPEIGRHGEVPLAEPEFSTDQAPPEFGLPPLPVPDEKADPLSHRLRVYVRSIVIQGNSILSTDELTAQAAPYIDRMVSTTELQELRRKLTLLLIDKGYITSGVILPDQTVVNGVIVLRVVQGVISELRIVGDHRLKADYIRDRLQLSNTEPLQLAQLQEQLQLLQLDPNIARLNAQLTPGAQLGESFLTLDVLESRRDAWRFAVNNHRSPSVGAIQGELFASYRNLTGLGDTWQVALKKSEGHDEATFGFSIPLRARGPILKFGYAKGESEVVERPFSAIDVESEFEDFSIGLSYRAVERLHRSVDLGISLDKRRSEVFLLGGSFPFPPRADDGESKVTVIRLTGDWREQTDKQAISIRSILSKGIDAFDATTHPQLPDGRFFSWLGQFQYARRLGENHNVLIVRSDLQLSAHALLPLEKFGVGGRHSVRGYRENELVRDNAWVSSIELRFPLFQESSAPGRIRLVTFADYGYAWNKGDETPAPRSIGSAGLGVRWDTRTGWYIEVYGAVPFRGIDQAEHDLQDSGVHFEMGFRSR